MWYTTMRTSMKSYKRRRIEVVITGLTRNQLGSNPPRVRISPSPPEKKHLHMQVLFYKRCALSGKHVSCMPLNILRGECL